MLFIDDLLLRAIGISLGPLDLIYILEVIGDYARDQFVEENMKTLRDRLKENRLLFELQEIPANEYMTINTEITRKLSEFLKMKSVRLNERINILG